MLEVGIIGESNYVVKKEYSARNIGSGTLDVLSTPMLLAFVEETAWKSISNFLEKDQTSVGTFVNFNHEAPTPINGKIICKTKLVKIEERKLTFEFEAFDNQSRIASGIHERFIVFSEKFQIKADNRLNVI
ncbi:MAG: thioesterase family protein [Alphaproteobacteria bacterium]|nr:thioesterase family protein [Alphaproteobacteria bacterium]